MSLMYGAQDTLVTADQLSEIPTPAPIGEYHNPVGYGDFLALVKHRLAAAGITIHQEEYVTAQDGQQFFGAMSIGVDGVQLDGMELTLGLRGSHNSTLPRAICLGTRVIVCSNLMFNGDLANVSTKQTTNVWERLPALVNQAIERIPALAQHETRRQHAYQERVLNNPRHGDAALVELHRRGALTSIQLGHAVAEWDNPSYEEHGYYGNSIWKLFNAVTEVQKPRSSMRVNMESVRRRTAIAAEFCDGLVGLEFAA